MDLFLESRDYKAAEFAVVPDMSAKSRALYHILEIVLLLVTAGIGSWMLQGRQVGSQTLSLIEMLGHEFVDAIDFIKTEVVDNLQEQSVQKGTKYFVKQVRKCVRDSV